MPPSTVQQIIAGLKGDEAVPTEVTDLSKV
jgi:hypothetical protein